MKVTMITCLMLASAVCLRAQDKLNLKWGKIDAADFTLPNSSVIDSNTNAVIIADVGNTSFEGNTNGRADFTMVYKRFKRIKIVNRNGFNIANVRIPVYHDGAAEEALTELKAVTYTLENGKVKETKLDEKSVFTDKTNKYLGWKKFTMPALQAGCIIEIAYTIRSNFYKHLRAWNFQGEYPCLWSEYEVHIPEFFHYISLTQGDQTFFAKTSKTESSDYSLRIFGGRNDGFHYIRSKDLVNRWVKKDVPPLKEESYTTTILNHLSRIEFQLHYVQYSETSERQDYMGNWYMACEKMLQSEYFGGALNNDNGWMGEELKTIVAGSQDKSEKIEKIYNYVRDHFTCTDHDALYAFKPLKTVFKSRNGNVAEINLLLVAMLRHEEIDADPLVLSTRSNGYPSDVYPLIDRFNYVVCAARCENKSYYLDASWPELGFGRLPIDCYNGTARTINKDNPFLVNFAPDSLKESKNTLVLIMNDEKGFPSGSYQSTLGYFESLSLREKLKKQTEKEFFKDLQTSYGSDLEIENGALDSLTKLEMPVAIHYDFNMASASHENVIYFNPMLSERYKENPFKAAERKYPVEMPWAMDQVYTFAMDIPEGYTVEELPKSARVAYNENEGFFEYLVQKNPGSVQLSCRIKLNKATFPAEEYNTLRDFFAFIVKKQNEQIVFKKKTS